MGKSGSCLPNLRAWPSSGAAVDLASVVGEGRPAPRQVRADAWPARRARACHGAGPRRFPGTAVAGGGVKPTFGVRPGRTPIPLGRRASCTGPLRRPSAESPPSRPRSAMPAPSKNTTRPRSPYARCRGPRPGHDCAQSLSDCPYRGRPTRIGWSHDTASLTHKKWIRTESVPRRRPATQFRQPQGELRPDCLQLLVVIVAMSTGPRQGDVLGRFVFFHSFVTVAHLTIPSRLSG